MHLAPLLGVTPSEFYRHLRHQKTRVPGLSCGIVYVILHLDISAEQRLVTVSQTHDDGTYCTSMALCCKNVQHFKKQLEMWANTQRDGRLAEYRWRPLFNAAVWLTPTTRVPCSNAAKMRNPLKLPGMPKLTKGSQPLVGRSSPYCGDMWRTYWCLTSFFRLSIHALVAKI